MKPIMPRGVAAACLLLSACASEPDHFYTLNRLPEEVQTGRLQPTVHVILSVDVPALVDRPEMVVTTSSSNVAVLDHQRWAVPLSDQMLQTLARDLESRRNDVLVADRAFDQGAVPPVKIKVDIVRLSAQRAGHAALEAHWRIVDPAAGVDVVDGDVFDRPLEAGGYDSIAKAYSQMLAMVADRLAAGLHRR